MAIQGFTGIETPKDITQPLLDEVQVQVSKLDADQYSAQDLDAATEGVFGSGNMSYASLQASITDLVTATQNTAEPTGSRVDIGEAFRGSNGTVLGSPYAPATSDLAGDSNGTSSRAASNSDRPVQDVSASPKESGNFTTSTIGTVSAAPLGASGLSQSGGGANGSVGADGNTGTNGSGGITGSGGATGANGTNGTITTITVTETLDGSDGADGIDGADGQNGSNGDTFITQNTTTYNDIDIINTTIHEGDVLVDIQQVLVDLNVEIGDITHCLDDATESIGDILTQITEITLTETTTALTEITHNITQTLSTHLSQITGLVEQVITLTGSVGDNVIELTNNLLNNLELDQLGDKLGDLGGTVADLETLLGEIVDHLHDKGEIIPPIIKGISVTINTVTDAVDQLIGQAIDQLGLGDGEATLVSDTVTQVTNSLTDILDNTLDLNAGGVVEAVVDTADQVVETIGDVSETLTDVLADPSDISENLHAITETIAQEITDTHASIHDVATEVAELTQQLGDLLGLTGNDDTDVALANDVLPVALPLDLVEDLAGDIDLLGGVGVDLLGAQGENTDNAMGDTDLQLVLDGDLVDQELAELTLDIPLDPVEALVGDIDLSLNGALDILGDAADGVIDLSNGGTQNTNVIAQLGDGVSELAQDVLGTYNESHDTDLVIDAVDAPLLDGVAEVVLNPVENLAGDIDLVADLGLDLLGAQGENTDNATGDTDLQLALDGDLVDNDLAELALDIPLDPVEALVGDIDLSLNGGGDILGDAADAVVDSANGGTEDGLLAQVGEGLEAVGEHLLGHCDFPGDTDISVDAADLPIIDLAANAVLDPVEDVVGDVDIATDLGLDPLGVHGETTDNNTGDTDLLLTIDSDLIDRDLVDVNVDIPLDPVEALVGDVDLSLDIGLDVLGQAADAVIDAADGGTQDESLLSQLGDGLEATVDALLDVTEDLSLLGNGVSSDPTEMGNSIWTETISDATSGLFGDLASLGGESNQLPDPTGTVAEGLGAILAEPVHHHHSPLGGLFG